MSNAAYKFINTPLLSREINSPSIIVLKAPVLSVFAPEKAKSKGKMQSSVKSKKPTKATKPTKVTKPAKSTKAAKPAAKKPAVHKK